MDKTAKAAKLRSQIVELGNRRGETERKAAAEQSALQRATQKRSELVGELAGADDAVAGYAHGEIDKLDREIVGHKRFIEAHESALQRIVTETDSLHAELAETERAIEQERRAEALKKFATDLHQAREVAADALANVRESLARFNTLGARGAEQFGVEGLRICNSEFEPFVLRESNLDAGGWRPASPSYTRLEFFVRPMTRR